MGQMQISNKNKDINLYSIMQHKNYLQFLVNNLYPLKIEPPPLSKQQLLNPSNLCTKKRFGGIVLRNKYSPQQINWLRLPKYPQYIMHFQLRPSDSNDVCIYPHQSLKRLYQAFLLHHQHPGFFNAQFESLFLKGLFFNT